MNFLQTFAETAETDGGLFGALGIDWRLLILQIVAFLIMVWVLGKFVYPWLMKSVDERQANIEAAAKAAKKAEAEGPSPAAPGSAIPQAAQGSPPTSMRANPTTHTRPGQ